MNIEFRPVREEEVDDFIRAESRGFGCNATDAYLAHGNRLIEADRTLAAFEGKRLVGTSTSHTLKMTVPGGAAVPTGGIAWVTVQPTHRRRGINTGMMLQQLHRIHERGEPLAALWPSESAIYGRFGYEMAAFGERWTVERQRSALTHSPEEQGQTSFVDSWEARGIFPDVYQRVFSVRSGMVTRNDAAWDDELSGTPQGRSVAEIFYVVYELDGRVDGYVKYRIDRSQSRLIIFELVTATDEAHAALST